jgi:hypothetical protein
LNGRSSQPRKQQTIRVRSGPRLRVRRPAAMASSAYEQGHVGSGSHAGRARQHVGSPCGNTMGSPSARWDRRLADDVPQHEPRAIRWYSITRWARGITLAAISRDGGASATHGELSSKSKYTAPVRRTERSTSDRTSAATPTPCGSDARSSGSDVRAGRSFIGMACTANRTLAHGCNTISHIRWTGRAISRGAYEEKSV